ncbi:MAG: hypothetical protein PHT07_10760 [Paludibacter sp.]|nr:hypothetical protein [Paludibacter sp.]
MFHTAVPFLAFEDADPIRIGHTNVKNQHNKITIIGNIEITKDKAGLEYALKIKRIVDASIDEMRRDKNLPEKLDNV